MSHLRGATWQQRSDFPSADPGARRRKAVLVASLRARDAKLFVDFRYRGQRCREPLRRLDTPGQRLEAQVLVDRLAQALDRESFDYATFFPRSPSLRRHAGWSDGMAAREPVPTLEAFATRWQAEKAPGWRIATRRAVAGILSLHLLPRWGHRRVDQVGRTDLLALRAELGCAPYGDRGPRSPKTLNRICGVAKSLLDEAALRHGFANPIADLRRLRQPRTEVVPFSMPEVHRILAAVDSAWHDYLVVRFFTGLRTGELHGLKWNRVDFARRSVQVCEAFSGGRTEATKTEGSRRDVQMSTPVLQALLRQRERIQGRSDYVFTSAHGGPLHINNVTDRFWTPLLARLGIPYRRLYQTRHTCATFWLAAGEVPEWIARQLGHASTALLFSTYSRYVPNLTRTDGSAMERLLAQARPARPKLDSRPARDRCRSIDHTTISAQTELFS